jgi:hypothetical protein
MNTPVTALRSPGRFGWRAGWRAPRPQAVAISAFCRSHISRHRRPFNPCQRTAPPHCSDDSRAADRSGRPEVDVGHVPVGRSWRLHQAIRPRGHTLEAVGLDRQGVTRWLPYVGFPLIKPAARKMGLASVMRITADSCLRDAA